MIERFQSGQMSDHHPSGSRVDVLAEIFSPRFPTQLGDPTARRGSPGASSRPWTGKTGRPTARRLQHPDGRRPLDRSTSDGIPSATSGSYSSRPSALSFRNPRSCPTEGEDAPRRRKRPRLGHPTRQLAAAASPAADAPTHRQAFRASCPPTGGGDRARPICGDVRRTARIRCVL